MESISLKSNEVLWLIKGFFFRLGWIGFAVGLGWGWRGIVGGL